MLWFSKARDLEMRLLTNWSVLVGPIYVFMINENIFLYINIMFYAFER